MCKQLPQCDVELLVYAETEWQRQNGKLWARQMFESIAASKDERTSLQYNLLTENLIVEVSIRERMYISPDTHHSPSCPESPKVFIPVRVESVPPRGPNLQTCTRLAGSFSVSTPVCNLNPSRLRAGTNKPALCQLAVARGCRRGEQRIWLCHRRHRHVSQKVGLFLVRSSLCCIHVHVLAGSSSCAYSSLTCLSR